MNGTAFSAFSFYPLIAMDYLDTILIMVPMNHVARLKFENFRFLFCFGNLFVVITCADFFMSDQAIGFCLII